jgi:zinc protease
VDFPWTVDPGLVVVGMTLRPGVEPQAAEDALVAELERMAVEPPSPEELRKAKNQLKADFFRRLKTNEGRADLLGGAEVLLGSWRELFELPQRYEAVTTDDVLRVGAAVLRRDNMTVAQLDPLNAGSAEGTEGTEAGS